ncbi:flavodoxin [Erysipelothrix larvae]|nr:flavodoxin [Erysipelothrix larvae]
MMGLIVLVFLLSACQTSQQTPSQKQDNIEPNTNTKILVLYFSMPEDEANNTSDSNAQASIVVRNNTVYGNVESVANIIHETMGGDIIEIETNQTYPLDHEKLVEVVSQEKEAQARPELTQNFNFLNTYDTIFLGYPIWWYDLPMPLYSLLEQVDLSGITIIPFTVHGGSGFSTTQETLQTLQPEATISNQGFSLSRNNMLQAKDSVEDWLNATFNLGASS